MMFKIDAHLDLLYDVVRQRSYGRQRVIETDYLEDFRKSGFKIIVSSIFLDSEFVPELALRRALQQVNSLYEEIKESPDSICLCKSYSDIEEVMNSDKIGILMSFEGVEPLYNDLSLLNIFYELGVRGIGLTWSRRNYAADGCSFSPTGQKPSGLTSFGVELVNKAVELGMFIDVSHLSDEGFWDVAKIIDGPFIASHSNSRNLVDIPRNLSDDQLREIAKHRGVIGINAASFINALDPGEATISALVDHIDYVAKLVGIDHVGFGFDLCDKLSRYDLSPTPEGMDSKPFDILKCHSDTQLILDELEARGYSKEDLYKICSDNFIRIFRDTLKNN